MVVMALNNMGFMKSICTANPPMIAQLTPQSGEDKVDSVIKYEEEPCSSLCLNLMLSQDLITILVNTWG